ncbi:hypothetical protein COOONC_09534 [Cooperia oncophora]
MTKHAEARLLHEMDERKPEINKMKSPVSATITGLACIVALISCLAFSIFFHKALSGFSKQVNAFVTVGDFSSVLLQSLVFIASALVIVYLLFVYLASARIFSNVFAICGSPSLLFFSSLSSQGFLILWVLMLCFVSSVSLVYFMFIGGILSFCALVDQQCFDFRVLIPAIVSRFSNKSALFPFLPADMRHRDEIASCLQANLSRNPLSF